MTEDAAGSLRSAASMLAGATVFKASRGPDGSVGRSYTSASCFVPTSDPALREKQAALRREIEGKVARWTEFLKKQADTDSSGFVSTQEGSAMRRRVEMAYIAAQVSIPTADELAKAISEERAALLGDIEAYAKLKSEAVKQGLEGMPEVPVVEGAV
jgi:hypothetical protein